MNEGQRQFLNFIMERVQDGKQEKAKELLDESFAKQADGTFNKEYAMEFIPRMMELLKSEYIEEVKNIMIGFGNKQ